MIAAQKRYAQASTWVAMVCPEVKKQLNKIAFEAKRYRALTGRNNEYEVKEFDQTYAINLRINKCSYGWWSISELLCRYVERCILHKKKEIYKTFVTITTPSQYI